MKRFLKRYGGLILVIINIIVVAYVVLANQDLRAGLSQLQSVSPFWCVLGILAVTLCIAVDGSGIWAALRFGHERQSLWKCIRTALLGRYYSYITPYGTGGQPAQMVELAAMDVSPGVVGSVITLRLLCYQGTMIVFSFISLLIQRNALGGFAWAWVVSAFGYLWMIVLLIAFYAHPQGFTRLAHWVFDRLKKVRLIKDPEGLKNNFFKEMDRCKQAMKGMTAKRWMTMIAISLLQILLLCCVPYCAFRTLGLHGASPLDMLMQCSVLTVAVAAAPTPGNSGVAEGGFFILFRNFFSEQSAIAGMLLWRVTIYYYVILLGAVVVLFRWLHEAHVRRRAKHA